MPPFSEAWRLLKSGINPLEYQMLEKQALSGDLDAELRLTNMARHPSPPFGDPREMMEAMYSNRPERLEELEAWEAKQGAPRIAVMTPQGA